MALDRSVFSYELDSGDLKHWVDELCKNIPSNQNFALKSLLRKIFPEVENAFENIEITPDSEQYREWRKTCRVCSREIFDKFFLLEIPTNGVSEAAMMNFVESLTDTDTINLQFEEALITGKVRRMLVRLEDYMNDLPLEHSSNLVKSLFALGDKLSLKSNEMIDMIADRQIPKIIYQCLLHFDSKEGQFNLLLDSILNCSALFTVTLLITEFEPKEIKLRKGQISDFPILSLKNWKKLRQAALDQICAANKDGSLWALDRVGYVLHRWIEWTSESVVREAVANHVHDDKMLVTFVDHMVTEGQNHGEGGKVARVMRKVNLANLQKLVDIDEVVMRLKGIASGTGDNSKLAKDLVDLFEQNPIPPHVQ